MFNCMNQSDLLKLLYYLYPLEEYENTIQMYKCQEQLEIINKLNFKHSIDYSEIYKKNEHTHLHYQYIPTITLCTNRINETYHYMYIENILLLKYMNLYKRFIYTLSCKLKKEYYYKKFIHYSDVYSDHKSKYEVLQKHFNVKSIYQELIYEDSTMEHIEEYCDHYYFILSKYKDLHFESQYKKIRICYLKKILNGIISKNIYYNIYIIHLENIFFIHIYFPFDKHIEILIDNSIEIENINPSYTYCIIYTQKKPTILTPSIFYICYKELNKIHTYFEHYLKVPNIRSHIYNPLP